MKRGDKVRTLQRSLLWKDFGEAVGTVTEADAKDGRCSVNFATLRCFAVGCGQDEFEVVKAAEELELVDVGCSDDGWPISTDVQK